MLSITKNLIFTLIHSNESWKRRRNKEHIHIRINPWSTWNMCMFSFFIWRQQPEISYTGVLQCSWYPILTPFELVISFDHWNNFVILGKAVTIFPTSSMKMKVKQGRNAMRLTNQQERGHILLQVRNREFHQVGKEKIHRWESANSC